MTSDFYGSSVVYTGTVLGIAGGTGAVFSPLIIPILFNPFSLAAAEVAIVCYRSFFKFFKFIFINNF